MIIQKLNPVECKVADGNIWHMLSYEVEYWTQGKFKREKKHRTESFYDVKTRRFPAGFLSRICAECARQNIPVIIEGKDKPIKFNKPHLQGISFRQDQIEMLNKVAEFKRGYLKAATGTGKTILAVGIHSMIEGRTLFLCHTIDLLMQSAKTFKDYGFNVVVVGGGAKEIPHNLNDRAIVVATVQTWVKLIDNPEYSDMFTAIIIDECHHISSEESNYVKILRANLAPIRMGLTATDQTSKFSRMVLEGYLGQMIGEFSVEEGIKTGVLSEPIIEWINVPEDTRLFNLTNYKDIYQEAIVNNRTRNRLIISHAIKEVEQNKSVLILVKEIEHGNQLLHMARLLGLDVGFVWSGVNKDDRVALKDALEFKHKKCVIATTVWKEGINIRSLDCIINGAGGKSEIAVLQNIGRGLRATEHKNQVTIKDFVDTYKYLEHHAIMRLQIYVANKWSMKGV